MKQLRDWTNEEVEKGIKEFQEAVEEQHIEYDRLKKIDPELIQLQAQLDSIDKKSEMLDKEEDRLIERQKKLSILGILNAKKNSTYGNEIYLGNITHDHLDLPMIRVIEKCGFKTYNLTNAHIKAMVTTLVTHFKKENKNIIEELKQLKVRQKANTKEYNTFSNKYSKRDDQIDSMARKETVGKVEKKLRTTYEKLLTENNESYRRQKRYDMKMIPSTASDIKAYNTRLTKRRNRVEAQRNKFMRSSKQIIAQLEIERKKLMPELIATFLED